MAYETGTATDYLDLLDKLISFLTTNTDLVTAGEDWSVVRQDHDPVQADDMVVLQGPGLAGADEIYVGFQPTEDVPGDWFNWTLHGYSGYEDLGGGSWLPHGASPSAVYMHLWDQSIPYWIVANGRRFVLVAKVSTVYEAAYGGLTLPPATAGQYPYPLFIGASGKTASQRWSNTNADHRHFTDPYGSTSSSALQRWADGTWWNFGNNHDDRRIWPSRYSSGDDVCQHLEPAPDDSYPLLPLMGLADTPSVQFLGDLEGCFWTTGYGAAAEDIITVGSDDYLVVQDVYRTAWQDYWALKLE